MPNRNNLTHSTILCVKLTPENTETLHKMCNDGNHLLQNFLSDLCNREIAMMRFQSVLDENS